MTHTHGITLNGGLDSLGDFFYEDSSGHVWYRDTVLSGGHTWSEILKAGDVTPVIWGNITGTLSNQTDLQNALNNKLSNITNYVIGGSNVNITGLGTLASPYVVNSTAPGTGTLTNFSFTNGNGLAGVVTNSTTTPALALGTSLNGIISGNGTGFSTVTIGSGLNYSGGVLTANGGTSLTGLVSANGSAFIVTNIGAGLSYGGSTLTNTINNTNQLTNGAGFLTNITSLISAGTNITITGSGTSGSPYVINSSGGGGGGTVTNFSAGTLSPLFTTSVSNPTTIPGLSFTMTNAIANSVLGNPNGTSGAYSFYVPTITTLNGWASGTIALLGASQTFTGNNIFNGTTTYGAAVAFSTTNSISVGGSSDVASHMWSRSFNSDVAAVLSSTTGNSASMAIGANNGITLLSTGQAQLNNYVANNSFTGSGIAFIENDGSGNLVQIPIGNIATQTALNDTAAALRATTSLFYPVQLLSPIGNSADSFALGGVAGPAFQNDSLYFANNKLFIYNLNASFSTLVAGDSVMVHGSGGQVKFLPSSAIGGGGAVSSVSDNGGGTLTISPNTGAVLAGINLANSNTWTATNNSFKNILPSATTTYSLGSTGAYWNNVYTNNLDVNNILPPSNLLIQLATGQSMQTAINGVTKEELLSTGQKQFNGYGSGTFTGTATYNLATTSDGHLIEVSTGGGSTLTRQTITSGTSATGTNVTTTLSVFFNFSTTASTFTFTMPPSPIDGQVVKIGCGGTIVYPNSEITTLTIAPNSGQNIIPTSSTLNTLASGESAEYEYISSLTGWLRER